MKLFKKICFLGCMLILLGQPIYGKTLESMSVKNVTLIPLRTVSEYLNVQVQFDKGSQQLTVLNEGKEIVLTLGSAEAYVNGEVQTLEVAPRMVNGVTYVPLRFIGEALGAVVNFQQGKVSIELGELKQEWTLKQATAPSNAFKSET
ncbi:MAG: copper amine oxidase N-terminal domain-containing protein, partial [Niameybacter sp.]